MPSQSPYHATVLELVVRFGTTAERNRLLRGLLNLRSNLHRNGLSEGFQWIDGSFVEDKEARLSAAPGDIDLVTVFRRPAAGPSWSALKAGLIDTLFSPAYCKANFSCESFYVDADGDRVAVALLSAFWFGLFSHQRTTYIWKGAVAVDLDPAIADDAGADAELRQRGF